jgi:hypothetical protein
VTTRARLSANRKYVVCGSCRRSLCRRDRRDRGGAIVHVLAWEDGWRVVGDHVEMMPSAKARLAEGHRPIRHDWQNEERLVLSRALRSYAPAVCPDCGEENVLDRQRLDVDGIAPQ